MPIVTLPIAEWAPDQFPIGSPGALTITNVVPRTATTYGSVPSASAYSGALTARAIGAYTIKATDKNVYNFAGDRFNLYLLKAGSTSYADVSASGGGLYSGLAWPATQWDFTSYGQRVIATNYLNLIQTYLVGTDSLFSALAPVVTTTGDTHTNTTLDNIADGTTNIRAGMVVTGTNIPVGTYVDAVVSASEVTLSQAATGTTAGGDVVFTSAIPHARYCEAVGDFLMVANTNDDTSGVQPQRVWWSAIGDPENWPTPGTTYAIQVQSDYQDLQQTDLGQITGLAAGPLPAASATIFCENGIHAALYGGSAIFSFRAIDGAPGCMSPLSIVKGHLNANGAVVPVIYYLARDGFYAFNGTSSVAIGANKIDRFVLAELDSRLTGVVLGAAAPNAKLVYWVYSSSSAANGLYDRAVVYNWDVNRWSYINLSSAKVEWLTQAATTGYTLEELDQFGNLDTLLFSLDSEVWVGGPYRLAAFNDSHQLAFFGGSNMAPTVETAEVEPVPGKRVFIRNARPLVDATGGSVAVGVRERQADSLTLKTAVLMNAMGECPQRVTGRYVKARFTFPAATSFTHISGVEVDVIQQGIR
jgi:hypothetical protein